MERQRPRRSAPGDVAPQDPAARATRLPERPGSPKTRPPGDAAPRSRSAPIDGTPHEMRRPTARRSGGRPPGGVKSRSSACRARTCAGCRDTRTARSGHPQDVSRGAPPRHARRHRACRGMRRHAASTDPRACRRPAILRRSLRSAPEKIWSHATRLSRRARLMFLGQTAESSRDADELPPAAGHNGWGPMVIHGSALAGRVRRTCVGPCGSREGSITGGQQRMERTEEGRGRGGTNTVGSPATGRQFPARGGHRSLIEREVVSGHAYAILAPETVEGGWCGYDNPTDPSVDGVSDPQPQGPGAFVPGPSSWR
jgi:hypothetical protein